MLPMVTTYSWLHPMPGVQLLQVAVIGSGQDAACPFTHTRTQRGRNRKWCSTVVQSTCWLTACTLLDSRQFVLYFYFFTFFIWFSKSEWWAQSLTATMLWHSQHLSLIASCSQFLSEISRLMTNCLIVLADVLPYVKWTNPSHTFSLTNPQKYFCFCFQIFLLF